MQISSPVVGDVGKKAAVCFQSVNDNLQINLDLVLIKIKKRKKDKESEYLDVSNVKKF